MDTSFLIQNPFAVLTFIAAPAILTNATSVLAMSTINRMLRSREWMHEMLRELDTPTQYHGMNLVERVNRLEQQGVLLLRAMHWIYSAMGSFAAATLITLLGALAGKLGLENVLKLVIGVGLLLGVTGVIGIIGGCVILFRVTQISLVSLREDAALIRARQVQRERTS